MKKIKNLKQQVITALSLILLVMAIAVCATDSQASRSARPAPTHPAQLNEGMSTLKAYQIEFNHILIGRVVVVGCENLNPPPGYRAGQEYWTWVPGAAWRGTFTLVPDNNMPNYYAYRWEKFPHQHFDLSRTVPMPAISPEAGDRFYRVQAQSGDQWVDQGWMWLIDGERRVQQWYAQNLLSDLAGTGEAMRFTSVEPPAPGSTSVYLLMD
jgi:hypothetical protein